MKFEKQESRITPNLHLNSYTKGVFINRDGEGCEKTYQFL